MLISVSGTIGVGKSTLCADLSRFTGYEVVSEPVSSNPFLEDFYCDPKRWAFSAQVFMVTHRFRRQMGVLKNAPSQQGIVLDRCFHEDRVFGEVVYEMGYLSMRDWDSYLLLHDSFDQVLQVPDVIVYLKIEPEVALERIRSRGRSVEAGITLEYMERLHSAYERWITDMKSRTKVLELYWDQFGDTDSVVSRLGLLPQQSSGAAMTS